MGYATAALGTQGNPLRPPVIGPSGPAQPRKQHTAICNAGAAVGFGLEQDRDRG